MSLHEKKQLKAVLMSIKEIDGNVSYPIFQEIFQNSIGYRSVNDEEQLVAYTNSIEQDVLDTGITRSNTVVLEGHQVNESTNDQAPSNENNLQIIEYHPTTTRSQLASIESHIASNGSYLTDKWRSTNIGGRSESTENHTAMDLTAPTMNATASAMDATTSVMNTTTSVMNTTTSVVNTTTLAENDTLRLKRKTRCQRAEKRTFNIVSLASLKDTDFSEQPLDKILLPNPREEMKFIKAHPERGSIIFRMRMSAINEPKSDEDKAFLDTFDVQDVMQVYKKPMSEFIGLLKNRFQSQLGKCRQMLCAYQIGKITEQLLRDSPQEGKHILEKRLFQLLRAAIIKNHVGYPYFVSLCLNSLYLVEHVGVHALFVPEVISPAVLKELDTGSLLSLAKHMANEWPLQFRKLARLTYYGEIVVSRAHNDDPNVEDGVHYPGRFLNNF
ncbi:unnamed protein product [Mucor fragilis]